MAKEDYEYLYKDELFSSPFTGKKFYYLCSLLLAEFLGTLFLMFLGCGLYIEHGLDGLQSAVLSDNLRTAIAWGTSYGAILVMISPVSGLCINPALVPVMVIVGKYSLYRMLLYWLVEFVGAILGVFLLHWLIPKSGNTFCQSVPGGGFDSLHTLVIEAWAVFALAVLLAAIYDDRTADSLDMGPVKISISIIALQLSIYQATGCSLNPARVFATAVLAKKFNYVWMYIVGQFSGALLGAFFYRLLMSFRSTDTESVIGPEE